MRHALFAILSMISTCAFAQKNVSPTAAFSIDGDVMNKISFSLKDAAGFSSHMVDSVVIYNHLQERKRVIRNIRGILLKDVLEKAGIKEEKPRLYSEFYFTCIAADGYKVVFSWNELFNTDAGDHVLIITEEDGKNSDAINDHIAIISPGDKATGRRYVQNLQQVRVERVQ